MQKEKNYKISRSEILQNLEQALHLDNWDYSYENFQEELNNLRNPNKMKEESDFASKKFYTLEGAYKKLKSDNELDKSISENKENKFKYLLLERQILCFRTGLCMLIIQCEGQDNKAISDNNDFQENWIIDSFMHPYEICLSLISQIFQIYEGVDNLSLDEVRKKINWLEVKIENALKEFVDDSASGKRFSHIDIEKLRIFTQLISFNHILKGFDFGDVEENFKQAALYVSYYFAELFSEKNEETSDVGMRFAKKALKIKIISFQQMAFNCYGIYAIEKGDLQLAYDTYYSWLNQCLVGNLQEEQLPNFVGERDDEFQNIGARDKAIMHNNFAYVCSMISESYELKSERRKLFYERAVRNMEEAIDLDNNTVFYSTYGNILCENIDDKEETGRLALEQFNKYESKADFDKYKVDSLREVSRMLIRLLTRKYFSAEKESLHEIIENNDEYKGYFIKFVEKAKDYQDQSNKYFSGIHLSASDERREWENWKYIFKLMDYDKGDNGCVELEELNCLLLMIEETASAIKAELQWREYVPNKYSLREAELDRDQDRDKVRQDRQRIIAYYSTLKTTTYIFEELCQETKGVAPHVKNKEDEEEDRVGKNCLTLMHAKYMNDPYEGLKLLNVLVEEIDQKVKINIDENLLGQSKKRTLQNVIWPKKAEPFREEIFSDYFVFLKSFTQQIDNLIMWNRYASDYSHGGQDSNGVFVELDANAFSNIIYTNEAVLNKTEKKEEIPEDNFHLYRVIYVSKSGEIEPSKNEDISPNIWTYYNALRRMICELNEYLCRQDVRNLLANDWENYIQCVRQSLQQSLRFIIFLFKEDDYADELESRMVFTKNLKEQEMIRLFDGTPKKVGVNPFFQTYITKIILGPNVRDAEMWKPYFQYQLNKMWSKKEELKGKTIEEMETPYEIKSSETHYRTYGPNIDK